MIGSMSDAIELNGGAVRGRRWRRLRCGFDDLRGGGRIRGIYLDSHLSSNPLIVCCECGWSIFERLGRNRDCRFEGGFRVAVSGMVVYARGGISLTVT